MRLAFPSLLVIVLLALPASAEDEKARQAREELERELHHLVGAQPTKVRVDFEALDEPNYALVDATFELDGRPLRAPLLQALMQEGTHLVWNGDVTPGKHVVRAHIAYANTASALITEEGGHTWKITGDVSFEVNSGIEVQVKVVPIRDGKQADLTKRFRLSLPAKPVMLAQLDDGTMPEPIAKKGQVVDAGPPARPTLAAVKPVTPPVAVAEVRPEPPPMPPSEPDAPGMGAPGPVAAAERGGKKVAAEPRPTEVTEVVDAGAAVAAAPSTPAKPGSVAAESAADDSGDDWILWAAVGGGGLVAVVALLVVLARRRSRPPSLD